MSHHLLSVEKQNVSLFKSYENYIGKKSKAKELKPTRRIHQEELEGGNSLESVHGGA